jgi:3-oxoadipate enol-lactonase
MSSHRHLESRRVQTWDGTEICAYESGPAEEGRIPIVLANGLGGPVQALSPQIERFSRERRVIAWDYRGLYGSEFADPGRDMSVRAHARDLLAVLDALELDRVAILGWSMGVQVALELAALAPDRAGGLVLLNGLAGKPLAKLLGPKLEGLISPGLTLLKRGSDAAQLGVSWAARFPLTGRLLLASGVLGGRFPEKELGRLLPHFGHINVARYLELLEGLAAHDAEATLGSLTSPTLVLGSSADKITLPSDGRRLAQRIRGGEYREISWATHYAALEVPDIVFEFTEEFLVRRVDPAV